MVKVSNVSELRQRGGQRIPRFDLRKVWESQSMARFTFPTHGILPCSLPADEEDNPVIEARLPGRTLPTLVSDFLTEVKSHILEKKP
jgi:hypothetical protein